MTTPIRTYWRLGQVAILMALVRLALILVKLPRILAWLSISRISQTQDFEFIQDVNYYSFLMFRWYPANPKGNCLPRSLILLHFARRCGFPVQFHCGVRWVNEALDGHAWLTLNKVPFLEPKNIEEEGYQETYSFPEHTTENIEGTTCDQDHSGRPEVAPIFTTGSPVGSTLSGSKLPKPQGTLSVKS